MTLRTLLLSALLAGTLASGVAKAHRVNADAVVSDDGTSIRIEAWLSGSKTPPKGAVIVTLPDGREIARGELSDGAFIFRPDQRERFVFNVQLGEGHAKRFELPNEQLERLHVGGGSNATPSTAPAPRENRPPERRDEEADTGLRVVVGLAAIAALTALGMSLSARRRLHRLEQKLGGRDD